MPWSDEVKDWSKSDCRLLARYVIKKQWVPLEGSKFDLQRQKHWLELTQCIYETLKKQEIKYDLEPLKFNDNSSQIIRPPDEILNLKTGTCLDLALLFVGACLANDLIACVVVLEGHALALVASEYDQRTPAANQKKRMVFDQGLITNRDQVEKLLEAGFVAVECTGFAHSDMLGGTLGEGRTNGVMGFETARKAGLQVLEKQPFVFAIDVNYLQQGDAYKPWEIEDPPTGNENEPVMKPEIPVQLQIVPPRLTWIGPDRETTLQGYLNDLEGKRFTVVKGLPGMGKTSFAAELARRRTDDEQRIFWFAFVGADWSLMCRHLASFLDRLDNGGLLPMVSTNTGSPSEKLAMLVSKIPANVVVCLDDLREVENTPELKALFRLIAPDTTETPVTQAQFILIGQDFPTEIENKMDPARLELGGYTSQDTKLWLVQQDIRPLAPELAEIWKDSQGCPELLEMAVKAFQGSPGQDLITILQTQPANVIDKIYETLTRPEKTVLDAMVIFERPVDELLLQKMATGENASDGSRLIDDLVDALLLSRLNHPTHQTPTILKCSGLVRLYRQNKIDQMVGKQYHEIAVDYYQSKAKQLPNSASASLLRAAHHTIAAGRAKDAVDLLEPNAAQIIDDGEVWALKRVLNKIKPDTIQSGCDTRVQIMKGEVADHLGLFEESIEMYSAAFKTVDGDWDMLARILEGLGNAYNRSGQPNGADLALVQLQKSRDWRVVLNDRGKIAETYRLIGMVYSRKQAFQDANEQLKLALEIAKQLRPDPNGGPMTPLESKIQFGLATVLMNNTAKGDPPHLEEARALFEKCRRAFHDQGNRRREAQAIGNLALLSERLGDAAGQLQAYQEVLQIQIDIGDFAGQRITYNNLGYLYATQKDDEKALETYQKLLDLSNRTGHLTFECFALAGMADVKRESGKIAEAVADAQSALACAKRINPLELPSGELGIGWRALGEAQLSNHETSDARASLEQAVTLLTDRGQEFEADLRRAQTALEQINAQPEMPVGMAP
jgi:tetratricopeptide (TPR) repeat protein